jgi:hypothetical protein
MSGRAAGATPSLRDRRSIVIDVIVDRDDRQSHHGHPAEPRRSQLPYQFRLRATICELIRFLCPPTKSCIGLAPASNAPICLVREQCFRDVRSFPCEPPQRDALPSCRLPHHAAPPQITTSRIPIWLSAMRNADPFGRLLRLAPGVATAAKADDRNHPSRAQHLESALMCDVARHSPQSSENRRAEARCRTGPPSSPERVPDGPYAGENR